MRILTQESASLYIDHLRVFWQELLDSEEHEEGMCLPDALARAFKRLDADITLEAQVPLSNDLMKSTANQWLRYSYCPAVISMQGVVFSGDQFSGQTAPGSFQKALIWMKTFIFFLCVLHEDIKDIDLTGTEWTVILRMSSKAADTLTVLAAAPAGRIPQNTERVSLFTGQELLGTLDASEIKTLEMSPSGTQCNPTRHFLNLIKMDRMIDNVTAIQVVHSPTLGEKSKAQKGMQVKQAAAVSYRCGVTIKAIFYLDEARIFYSFIREVVYFQTRQDVACVAADGRLSTRSLENYKRGIKRHQIKHICDVITQVLMGNAVHDRPFSQQTLCLVIEALSQEYPASQTAQLMPRYLHDNVIPLHRRRYCHVGNGAGKKMRPLSKLPFCSHWEGSRGFADDGPIVARSFDTSMLTVAPNGTIKARQSSILVDKGFIKWLGHLNELSVYWAAASRGNRSMGSLTVSRIGSFVTSCLMTTQSIIN
ncbi:hypothetical protein PAMA_015823 [Pampus argenteus]